MAHCPLGSVLISSCFIAQSAAASLAVVSVDEPVSAPPGAAGALAAGAVVAGAALLLTGELGAELSGVVSLFLQPLSNASERKQQIRLGRIFIGVSRTV